jgi:hypothetical protein
MTIELILTYLFREERRKLDVRTYNNGTISYREARNYTFERSQSAESETVNVTTVNFVYMVDPMSMKLCTSTARVHMSSCYSRHWPITFKWNIRRILFDVSLENY